MTITKLLLVGLLVLAGIARAQQCNLMYVWSTLNIDPATGQVTGQGNTEIDTADNPGYDRVTGSVGSTLSGGAFVGQWLRN